MLQQLLGRHQKGKLIWGIILSLSAPFNMLGRRLLVKTAINLAKRANRGCRRSAPRSSRLATPRLPAMIEQPQFWVVWFCCFFFISSQRQRFLPAANPQRGSAGGVAQRLRFNCHFGVSGLISDGASVYFPPGDAPTQDAAEEVAQPKPFVARLQPETASGRWGGTWGAAHGQTDGQTLLHTLSQLAFEASFYHLILHSGNKAKGTNCSFHLIKFLPKKLLFPHAGFWQHLRLIHGMGWVRSVRCSGPPRQDPGDGDGGMSPPPALPSPKSAGTARRVPGGVSAPITPSG